VSAADADSGDKVSLMCTPQAPAQFPLGDTTVTCQAADRAGNTASAQFIVRVVPPPPSAAIDAVDDAGPIATVTVSCQGVAGQTCTGTLVATAPESLHGGSVVAVGRVRRNAAVSTKQIVVASSSFSIPAGKTSKVRVKLTKGAGRLLDRFYRLPAMLSIQGGVGVPVIFKYPRIIAPVLASIDSRSNGVSTFSNMHAILLPPTATVAVQCEGGPHCGQTFHTTKHRLDMTAAVANKRFAPGDRVTVTITSPNRIGTVTVFTIPSYPKDIKKVTLCLPPGERTPTRCH
jgi:hypothetical protein